VVIFDEHNKKIDLLLTDVVMPFMSGPALAQLLSERNPELKVLFMSGHTDNRLNLENVLENGVQFLPKPFTTDALIKKVNETLAGTGLPEGTAAPSGGSN
jgi:two-component system cell cycle sensor histidine kinase/response regulator CckA